MPNAPFLAPERDSAYKPGRAKAGATQFYCIPGTPLISTTTTGPSSGTDTYTPWFTDTPIIIDQLAFEVTTLVSGNARVGFYAADTDWQPVGPPLADSGDISTNTTGVKTYTPGTPIFVPRGRYLSIYNNSASPVVRAYRGSFSGNALDTALGATALWSYFNVSRAYAAFPTPGTAWTAGAGAVAVPFLHHVFYRVSSP